MTECPHIRLVKQEGPFEKGTRWVCEGCSESFRITPWGEITSQKGTKEKEKP
jgi:hypothetical protein